MEITASEQVDPQEHHLVVAEVDGEALGGADRSERFVGLIGLDERHDLASHCVLVPRSRLENCREPATEVRFKGGLGQKIDPTRREVKVNLTLVGDLDGMGKIASLDVAVERGE